MGSLPITVFTPAYNRNHTLSRVYESLLRQDSSLFEWLVVDDGSTDSTVSTLAKLQSEAPFNIRFISQPNGGKHRAHNTAVRHANGELTLILDSDDELVEGAVEAIWDEWCAIPAEMRPSYA